MSSDFRLCLVLCIWRVCLAQHFLFPVFINESALVPRVVKGTLANLGDVPYQVGFMKKVYQTVYDTFCGGSIITEIKVLSAAHCFVESYRGGASACAKTVTIGPSKLKNIAAVAGFLPSYGVYGKGGQWRKLQKVIHLSSLILSNTQIRDDVAIVVLASPLQFNNHVNKIGIARRKKDDYRGSCLISGYGYLRKTQDPKPEDFTLHLLKADIQVLPRYYCNNIFRQNMNSYICAKESAGPAIAQGDSGGPLVCDSTKEKESGPHGVVVGITCGYITGLGDMYTRVATYTGFIDTSQAWHSFSSYNYVLYVTSFINYIVYNL